MFLARSASFLEMSKPDSASTVIDVSAMSCTAKESREPSSSGLEV